MSAEDRELPGTSDAPCFFASAAEFRAWLEANHETATELVVGFWKRSKGRPSMTWRDAVGEALCFGWIDGIGRSLGPDAFSVRFTPRRRRSNWSAVNIARVEELTRLGRMAPAGLRAFAARDEARAGAYAHERANAALEPAQEEVFRASPAAWAWFSAQPPSYRRVAIWWVVSAKREETRERRLATLVADSAAGRRIAAATLERRPAK